MRKTFTIITILLCAMCACAQKTITTVSTPEENGNPAVTVTVFQDTDGKYYIETVLDLDGTEFGKLCIGDNRSEARKTLEITRMFLENPEMDFLLFHVNKRSYLKLCRIDECDIPEEEEDYDDIPPYITDGSDIYSEIPVDLIRKALRKI